MTRRLGAATARRIALAAQGFADPRPAQPGMRDLSRILRRLSLLQIDSVNVAVRAHYMPLFSRLGPYDRDLLHRAAGSSPRRLFEYWGHVASFIRVDLQPDLRFRMSSAEGVWGGVRRLAEEQPGFVDWVLEEVVERGPLTAREIETDIPRETGNWGWNWSAVKIALEWLFYIGDVTVARRNSQFERVYDLPERVLPRAVLAAPTPDIDEAHRELVRASAEALGVATERELRDYFRLAPKRSQVAVAELVDSGELLPIEVIGWTRPAYQWHRARAPRTIEAAALLSPFDSLIFERERTEQLFDYRYRIEIYVPAAQRVYGYYVYSFLYGDEIVARVDLKTDRRADALRVVGSFGEPGLTTEAVVRLGAELRSMAEWLGVSDVVVEPNGDLAAELAPFAANAASRTAG